MTTEQSKRRCPTSLLQETHATDQLKYRDLLQSLFKDSQTYRQLANIFLEVASRSGVDSNLMQELKQNLSSFQLFNQLINIKGETFEGRIEQPSADASLNTGHASLESFVNILNSSMERQKEFQQKKQFLGSIIRKLISQVPKTACDIENTDFSQTSRFKAQFPRYNKNFRIDPNQPVTIGLLKKQIQSQQRPKDHDYLLESRLLKTSFGHGAMDEEVGYSPIFNVIYDKSGRLIISADEDGLIKIWSSQTGLLLWSFRGHVSFIEQLHITESNRFLVSCANDGIRVWCLETKACLVNLFFQKTVLTITSYISEETNEQVICFADSENFYKMTQSEFIRQEGKLLSVDTLRSYPLPKNKYQNNLVCQIQISSNKNVVIGFQSGQIVIFDKALLKLDKVENIPYVHSWDHTDKCVQIKWNDKGTLLASCSLDGSCRIWQFSQSMLTERTMKCVKKLQMHRNEKRRQKQKDIICNTVNWTCNYNYIIIAFSECNKDIDNGVNNVGEGDIVILDANKMEVLHEAKSKFPYQLESISVLEPHPIFENIALYCGSTGRVVIFDIFQCCILSVMNSRGFHVEHPNFDLQPVDGKWHPSGDTFVVSSEFGNVSIYGYGSKDFYHICPTDQFFSSDSELFTLDDFRRPISVDAPIDINSPDRGYITNINKNPYNFRYYNDLQLLKSRNTPYTYDSNHSYDIPPGLMNQMIQQRGQNQNHEEALRVASLSISKVELMEQYRINQEKLDETLRMKIQQFNGGSYKRLEYKETDFMEMVEEPGGKQKKIKFKRLKNLSDQDELSVFSQAYSEESSESEVIPKKRTRREVREQPTEKKVRRTPIEQMKQMDEEYEIYRKNEKRKRLHQINDDDDDVYVAPESKKEPHTDAEKCKRCQVERKYKSCEGCGSGYCQNCSLYRGKDENFKCFECYVKENELNEERTVFKNVYEQDHRNKFYVPQIGDEVYFFFQGYEEIVQKFHESFPNKLYQIHQRFQFYMFDEEKQLRNIPLCTITRIDYMYPIKSRDRMSQQGEQKTRHNLLVLLKLVTKQTKIEFSVVFIYEQVNYLVRKEVLDRIHREDAVNRLKINDTVISKGRDFIITKKSPLEQETFPSSSWKYLMVHNSAERLRRNSSGTRRISPWEIDRYCQLPYEHLDETLSRKIMTNIQHLHSAKKEIFEYLYFDVDTKVYRDYNEFVEVGISVQKIEKRLKNKYYRGKDSIIFDINLIVRNSETYNGTDHIVTQHTLMMRQELLKIVETNGSVVYNVEGKKETRKAIKRIEQIEEYQSQSYVQESKSLEHEYEQSESSISSNRILTRSRRGPREVKQPKNNHENNNRRVTRSTRL